MAFPLVATLSARAGNFGAVLNQAKSQLGTLGTVSKTTAATMAASGIAMGAAFKGIATKFAGSAIEFETLMTQIVTLVGVSREKVDDMGSAILKLAPSIGVLSTDMARALFAITSGGERGARAMDILVSSAKASRIGLGNMADIAKVTTAALQAYSSTTLTAERATNIMLATVREGNLEAKDLPVAMGRVMGTAASLGVSFEEVGASIATFTRQGANAEIAATSLRAMMFAFLNPGKQAQAMFKELGTTAGEFRHRIREVGWADSMIHLIKLTRDYKGALGNVMPNIRGMSGLLGTAGVQQRQYMEVLESINREVDLVSDGFAEVGLTTEDAMRRAEAAIDAFKINISNNLLPALEWANEKVAALFQFMSGGPSKGILFGMEEGSLEGFKSYAFAIESLLVQGYADIEKVSNESFHDAADKNRLLVAFYGNLVKLLPTLQRASVDEEGFHSIRDFIEYYRTNMNNLLNMEIPLPAGMNEFSRILELLERSMADWEKARELQKHKPLIGDGHLYVADANVQSEMEQYIERLAGMKALEGEISGDSLMGLFQHHLVMVQQKAKALEEIQSMRVNLQEDEEDTGPAPIPGWLSILERWQEQVARAQRGDWGVIKLRLDREGAPERVISEVKELFDIFTDWEDEQAEAARLKVIADAFERRKLELRAQTLEYTKGARAVAEYRLENTDLNEQQKEQIRTLMDEVDALKVLRDAKLEELRKERAEIADKNRMYTSFADAVSYSFERMIRGTDNVADAFKDMIVSMILDLARLEVRMRIIDFFKEQGWIKDITGHVAAGLVGGTEAVVGEAGGGTGGGFALPSSGGGGQQTVVNQSITFSPSFVDGASGAAWLRNQSPTITRIVADGARRSRNAASAIRGSSKY